MSIKTLVRSILGHIFTAKNLTAGEAFVAEFAPTLAADLLTFSATLAPEFLSLEKLAEQAIVLWKEAKGVDLSKGLAILLAQSVFTGADAKLEAEAAALLKAA